MNFNDLLKRERERSGLSFAKLAKLISNGEVVISDSYLCRLENGERDNITVDKLICIIDGLGLNETEVLNCFRKPQNKRELPNKQQHFIREYIIDELKLLSLRELEVSTVLFYYAIKYGISVDEVLHNHLEDTMLDIIKMQNNFKHEYLNGYMDIIEIDFNDK